MTAKVYRTAEIELMGSAEPDQIFYGGDIKGESSMFYEEEVGGVVVHSYVATNRGPWKARRLEVIIDWPYEVENNREHGKWLLYLLEAQVQGNGYCETGDLTNPLKLRVSLVALFLVYQVHVYVYATMSILCLTVFRQTRFSLSLSLLLSICLTLGPLLQTSYEFSIFSLLVSDFGFHLLSSVTSDAFLLPFFSNQKKSDFSPTVSVPYRRRPKREVAAIAEELKEDGKVQNIVTFDCYKKTARCSRFSCFITDLKADQTAVVRLRARLWNSTFVEDYAYGVNQVHIHSHARIKIDSALDIRQNRVDNDQAFAKTKAYPDLPLLPPQDAPLWAYLLATILGLLLLVVLVGILWKVSCKHSDHSFEYLFYPVSWDSSSGRSTHTSPERTTTKTQADSTDP